MMYSPTGEVVLGHGSAVAYNAAESAPTYRAQQQVKVTWEDHDEWTDSTIGDLLDDPSTKMGVIALAELAFVIKTHERVTNETPCKYAGNRRKVVWVDGTSYMFSNGFLVSRKHEMAGFVL